MNALAPLMHTYTQDALIALTNFALCEESMAEQIFVTHQYASHISAIKFSWIEAPYYTLGVCLKYIKDL